MPSWNITHYIVAALLLVVTGLGITLKVQSARLDHCKNAHETFLAEVNIERKESLITKQKLELDFKALLGAKNEEYAKATANFDSTIARMRRERDSANSSIVPAASDGKSSSVPKGLICFEQSELDAAQRESETEIEEILFECGKTTNKYTCAVDWIDSLPKNNNSQWLE